MNGLLRVHLLYKFPRRPKKDHKYLIRMGWNDPNFEGATGTFAITPIIFDLIAGLFLIAAAFVLPGSEGLNYWAGLLSGILALSVGVYIIYTYITFLPHIWRYVKGAASIEGEIIDL
ncbi:MAG: hypothetical protein QG553_613 [Patescibacteria group bacterium]|nr:hypothetical protein [Patescibacteria group bacterium]